MGLVKRDGWIPQHWWEPDGNYGPWRTFYAGRSLVEQAFAAPLPALGLAYLARPTTRIAVPAGGVRDDIAGIGITHFWWWIEIMQKSLNPAP